MMGDDSDHAESPRLVDRVEANVLGHLTWPHRVTPGMRVIEADGLALSDSGLATDTFNTVFVRELPEAGVTENLLAALAYFRARRLPYAVWVGPRGVTSAPRVLGGLGLGRVEEEPGMWLDLARWRPERVTGPVEARLVADREGLEVFADLLAALWEPPDGRVAAFFRLASAAILSRSSPMILMVGSVGGEPVGTCGLFVSDGVAGVYNVSTLRSHRGRGIGTAMVRAGLDEAARLGCDLAALQASSDGLSVYRRLGFRPFGTFLVFHEDEVGHIDPGARP